MVEKGDWRESKIPVAADSSAEQTGRSAGGSVPHQRLRRSIRQALADVEPGAEIILYGSRARGDARPDSDWDLLILVDGPVDCGRKDRIRSRLYEVELSSEEVLGSVIVSREDWNSPRYRVMPFHQSVEREGMAL